MIGGKELRQDTRQKLDLARRSDELVVDQTARIDLIFNALKKERMLTDLSKLHELVTETLDTSRFAADLVSSQKN